jgi:hypothetical protein
MTKLKKLRYRVAFAIIDKFSHVVYRLREQHLVVFNDKLDKLAGYYWEELEDEKLKNEIIEMWYEDRLEFLPPPTEHSKS